MMCISKRGLAIALVTSYREKRIQLNHDHSYKNGNQHLQLQKIYFNGVWTHRDGPTFRRDFWMGEHGSDFEKRRVF